MKDNEVVVILPAFNEEKTIATTIANLKSTLTKTEIVVVDNASDDLTREIARRAKVTVLNEPRRGKGFTVQRGFNYALSKGVEVIAIIDADNTYEVKMFPHAIGLIKNGGYDMVTGVRVPATRKADLDSQEQRHFRFGHKAGNRMFISLSNFLLPTGIRDVLSGWRVMSKRFVASFPGDAKGFEIEAQLNSHAFSVNAAVTNLEVPYFARPSGSVSKLNTYSDGLRILRTTMRNFRNDRPVFAFALLALPWAIATVYFLYLPLASYFEDGLVPYLPRFVAAVGTFLISALLWISGVLLERMRQIRVAATLRIFHSNSH